LYNRRPDAPHNVFRSVGGVPEQRANVQPMNLASGSASGAHVFIDSGGALGDATYLVQSGQST
jgi:hypothetical protein